MHEALTTLINRLDSPEVSGTNVIAWSCPIPSFGDVANSKVATVGLNPSSREFVSQSGAELYGEFRRFHTLNSLGMKTWSELDARHLRLILDSCRSYFLVNPYDTWFRRLDAVVSGADASYYDVSKQACHLDIIPYATERKWSELGGGERSLLLRVSGDTLAVLLRDAPVKLLILNGASVVDHFEKIAGMHLDRREMPAWSLPRRAGPAVKGYSYKGVVSAMSGVHLGRELMVLGFNHNIQGSFGVTNKVIGGIRSWIAKASTGAIP